ncbi:MAG: glycerol kinase GlpK [Acidobacteriota bacterium]|nr:glycerol kinase GlpK [Acidobacteriota bacterium]
MKEAVLAIDQGTTGTTVIAFDRRGEILARAYAEFPQIYPKPGWVEHDPEVIWQTTEGVIREVLTQGFSVQAVGITNQRETTVIWDRHSGKPIHNAVVWQCRRTADLCRDLASSEDIFRQKTGLVIDAYFSGTKVRWLLDHVADARAKAAAGDLCFGTIDTWLIWKLTGGKRHVTDFTNACRTLMFNIDSRKWDPELLSLLDIPDSLLPEVCDSSGSIAVTRADSVFGAEIPITGIAGDQQASLYGNRCTSPGLAKNTYGTGCFLMVYNGEKRVSSRHGLLTTLACRLDGKPAYALEGAVFIAGAAVQWLRDQLGVIESAPQTEGLAESLADNGGVYLVPAFAGLGAPYWDMDARGALTGITRGAGRAHFARAALESIAYQSKDVLVAMQADTGAELTELRVDGGASNNGFLMQFQADLLGIPVRRGDHAEMTAFGAALLAGRALDFWEPGVLDNRAQDADQADATKVFTPKASKEDMERVYAGWKRAVASVRTNAEA